MKTISLAVVALLSAASVAQAQYVGPSTSTATSPGKAAMGTPTTVTALRSNGKDDMVVVLQGKIVRHLGGEKYRFADTTGEIDLEIDADKWPANTPIDDKITLRLQGEFDKNLLTDADIDVDRIEIVK